LERSKHSNANWSPPSSPWSNSSIGRFDLQLRLSNAWNDANNAHDQCCVGSIWLQLFEKSSNELAFGTFLGVIKPWNLKTPSPPQSNSALGRLELQVRL
jgi:hypothetical protein